MNRSWLLSWAVAFCGLDSPGQTNTATNREAWFSVPTLCLRALAAEPAATAAAQPRLSTPDTSLPLQLKSAASAHPAESLARDGQLALAARLETPAAKSEKTWLPEISTGEASLFSEQMTLSSGGMTADTFSRLDIYRRLEAGGYLTRFESQSPVERFTENVFRPELLRFRNTTVSCTVITAIKRKNPLCLLNPIFFQVTW